MTISYKDFLGNEVFVKSRTDTGEEVPIHDVARLPGTVESDIGGSKGFLQTLAGAVASARVAVDLSATVVGYLQKLSDAFSGSGFNVNLLGTPAANLATLAGAISAARMAVDLAATPTANLATLAGAITAARMQVDLASTPTANLATLAAAISSSRMQVDLATTPTANLATIASALGVPTALYSAQANAATGTATAPFSSQAVTGGALVKSIVGNTASIFLGPSGVTVSTGYELKAGESIFIPIDNVNKIYAISGTGSQTLCYFAT